MIQQTKQWEKEILLHKLLKFKHFFSPFLSTSLFSSVPTLGITYFFPKKKSKIKQQEHIDEKEFRKSKTKNTNRKFFGRRKKVEREKDENKSWFIGIAIGLLKLFFSSLLFYWLLYRIGVWQNALESDRPNNFQFFFRQATELERKLWLFLSLKNRLHFSGSESIYLNWMQFNEEAKNRSPEKWFAINLCIHGDSNSFWMIVRRLCGKRRNS